MRAATRVLTCPLEEDVLDRAREDHDDEEDALAARRPALFCPGRASRSMEICQAVSLPGLFGNPDCLTSPLAQDAKQSQEANVPTRTSRLCWQFGEIRAQEPSVPPKVNRGSVD